MLTSRSQGASRNIKEWDQQEGYQVPICSNQNLAGGSCSEPELLPHPSSGFTHTTPGGCHGDRGHSDWLWLMDIIGLCLHLWPTSSYMVIIPTPEPSSLSILKKPWWLTGSLAGGERWWVVCFLWSFLPTGPGRRLLREKIKIGWGWASHDCGCVAVQNLLKCSEPWDFPYTLLYLQCFLLMYLIFIN